MSEYEEYDEGTSEFQDEVYREYTYKGTPTVREILLIKKFLQDEARQLASQQYAILEPEKLKAHRVLLYHAQMRISYWEQVMKQQEPHSDPLLKQAVEQVNLDAKQREETQE